MSEEKKKPAKKVAPKKEAPKKEAPKKEKFFLGICTETGKELYKEI